jgi:hypothetical protein
MPAILGLCVVDGGVHADSGPKIDINTSQIPLNRYLWSVWDCILSPGPNPSLYLDKYCGNKNAWNFWHIQSYPDIVPLDIAHQ